MTKYEVVIFGVGGEEDLNKSGKDGEDCEEGLDGIRRR